MFGAILGGLLAGAGSLFGSKSASDAASDSADAQLAMQREMFDRMDELQSGLYDDQRRTIGQGYRRNLRDINGNVGQQIGLANALGMYGMLGAQQTRNQNVDMFGREMRKGSKRIRQATNKSIGGIKSAQRRSVQGFRPYAKAGRNALAAFAENLGVGNAKGYKLSMTPGSEFLMDKMQEGYQGTAAADGSLFSGATLEALQKEAAGIAALDRDNQQAQLLGLAGMGQNAAGSIANLRTGAAGNIANLRTGGAQGINALRGGYTDRIAGANDQLFGQLYGIGSDWTRGVGGALDTGTGRRIDNTNLRTANLGGARNSRANLFGSAAGQYMQGAGQAYQQQGQAGMLGAMGWQNALANGVNTGFGIHGYMGGQLPWGGQSPATGSGYNPSYIPPANYTNPQAPY